MEISCHNLSIGYGNMPLHEDISFHIPAGSYVCVVGENGAGKTTLIKTLLGLIPPIKGSITIGDGEKTYNIGYLPQQTQVQKDFPASVMEVVLSGCLNKMGMRPFYSKSEKVLAKKMLGKLGVAHIEKKSYSQLSGGQQQRVLLARALCATNDILLLDEPTAALDIGATAEFYEILRKLNAEGTTIIMITHNLPEAIDDADYILCINNCAVQCMTKSAYEEEVINV